MLCFMYCKVIAIEIYIFPDRWGFLVTIHWDLNHRIFCSGSIITEYLVLPSFFCHLLRYKKENILIMANSFSRDYTQHENFDGISLHHVDGWIRKKSLYMDDIWISISQLGRFGLAC